MKKLTTEILKREGYKSWIELYKIIVEKLGSDIRWDEDFKLKVARNGIEPETYEIRFGELCTNVMNEVYPNLPDLEDLVYIRRELNRGSYLQEKYEKTESIFNKLLKITAIYILMFIPLLASAQKPWQELNIDSTEFVQVFGSMEQYNYQKGIERESKHKTLCVWTGAKVQWMYNFAMYLSLENYDVVWDDEQEGKIVIEATRKIYTTTDAPVIEVVAPFDEEGKILSAKITGPADDLIHIFIGPFYE